ncbi:MAG TPA: hypothetical protein VIY48_12130 [Candidatus Paceibacterota bacterium]
MASKYQVRYNDSTAGKNGKPESAGTSIRIITMTAGNAAATVTALGTLLTAIQAVSLGLLANETIVWSDTYSNAGFATDKHAQRENKWLVTMEDNTTHRTESFTIPCADLDLLPDNHSELMDLTAGAGLALKQAVEAVYRSVEDNACTIVSVKFVGRTL